MCFLSYTKLNFANHLIALLPLTFCLCVLINVTIESYNFYFGSLAPVIVDLFIFVLTLKNFVWLVNLPWVNSYNLLYIVYSISYPIHIENIEHRKYIPADVYTNHKSLNPWRKYNAVYRSLHEVRYIQT